MAKQPTKDLRDITSEVDKFANTLWVKPPTTNDLRAITALIARIRDLSEAHGSTLPWGPKFEVQLGRARKQRRRMRSTSTVERDREKARIKRAEDRLKRAEEQRAARQLAAAIERDEQRGIRSVLPVGMVQSSRLTQGRHEVRGGLPGTSRRH
jgi:hypothetical protein